MKIVSNVKFLDNDTVFILKDKQIVGELSPAVGIALRDKTVLVASMRCSINETPVIVLVKECGSSKEAVRVFYRIVGSMCSKTADSKYFDKVDVMEHISNGNPKSDDVQRKRYSEIAVNLKEQFDLSC